MYSCILPHGVLFDLSEAIPDPLDDSERANLMGEEEPCYCGGPHSFDEDLLMDVRYLYANGGPSRRDTLYTNGFLTNRAVSLEAREFFYSRNDFGVARCRPARI